MHSVFHFMTDIQSHTSTHYSCPEVGMSCSQAGSNVHHLQPAQPLHCVSVGSKAVLTSCTIVTSLFCRLLLIPSSPILILVAHFSLLHTGSSLCWSPLSPWSARSPTLSRRCNHTSPGSHGADSAVLLASTNPLWIRPPT